MAKEKKKEKSDINRTNCATYFKNQENTLLCRDTSFDYKNTLSNMKPRNNDNNTSPKLKQSLYETNSRRSHTNCTKLNYISNSRKRTLTFNKRSRGIMKKIIDLFLLTGAESLFIISEPGSHDIYTIGTEKFKALIRENDEFKKYIKKALNTNLHMNNKNESSENK